MRRQVLILPHFLPLDLIGEVELSQTSHSYSLVWELAMEKLGTLLQCFATPRFQSRWVL